MNNLKDKKIAIYGGSFNPIHNGHLITAHDLIKNLNFDYILFVPANIPVHKDSSDFPPAKDRANMVREAIEPVEQFIFSDIEINRGGLSYTYDTVVELIKQFGLTERPAVIIGNDLLAGLAKWKKVKELQELSQIICLRRNLEDLPQLDLDVEYYKNRVIELSSTEIRKRIKENSPIDFMVPHSVKKYIIENNLYRN